MRILTLFGLIMATAPAGAATTDAVVQRKVSEAYGKPVPVPAVCIARPELPDTFDSDVIAAGVTQGTAGCRLYGVLVRGTWFSTAEGLPAALGGKWSDAKDGKRSDWLALWTEQVVLAFDQVDADSKAKVDKTSSGGWEVTVPFSQRAQLGNHRRVTRDTEGIFTYDGKGTLETSERDNGMMYKTAFTLQEKQNGGVMPDRLHASIKQKGGRITQCWNNAWERNHKHEGRILMRWTLRSGKAGQVSWVDEGKEIDEALARCYSGALDGIAFPEDMSGTVTWSFSVHRADLKPK